MFAKVLTENSRIRQLLWVLAFPQPPTNVHQNPLRQGWNNNLPIRGHGSVAFTKINRVAEKWGENKQRQRQTPRERWEVSQKQ